MPIFQFSFPFDGADTYTVLFDAAPANATYNWNPPYQANPQARQVVRESVDGSKRGYSIGTAPRLFVLNFRALPVGDNSAGAVSQTTLLGYLGMLEFFTDATDWARLPFGFYDHEGASEIEVRYVRGFRTIPRFAGGLYSATIVLEEEL